MLSTSGCQQYQAYHVFDGLNRTLARQDIRRGEQALANGNETDAARLFARAARRDPRSAVAHANLGDIREAAGDHCAAAEHYRAAVRLAPDDSDYAVALADNLRLAADVSLDRRRMLEASARAYRYVRRLQPDHFSAAIHLGTVYRELGRLAQAVRALRDAEQLMPHSAEVHRQLGLTYEAQGKYGAALREFSIVLRTTPEDARVHNACGRINLAMNRKTAGDSTIARERALAHLRKSLQIDADQPGVRSLLAQLEQQVQAPLADAGQSEGE
ncbi:MAG: tetratricopeptide repeat protein [Planctomycetota bacterium]